MQKFRRRALSIEAVQHTDVIPRIWYTMNGPVVAERGDWIVHEPSGLVWLCTSDDFNRLFEPEA